MQLYFRNTALVFLSLSNPGRGGEHYFQGLNEHYFQGLNEILFKLIKLVLFAGNHTWGSSPAGKVLIRGFWKNLKIIMFCFIGKSLVT